MKILLIKTSSLGDVLHTLPALTDAVNSIPNFSCDWVVEEDFAEVPSWHPAVKKIIPVALRRWRKNPFKAYYSGEWKKFLKTLREERYDLVLDAQGLLKSAFISLFTRGERCGLDRHSAWEPLASFVYQRQCAVNPDQHAVPRVRQLFAKALNYEVPQTKPDYGLELDRIIDQKTPEKYVVFLHGTTWETKHYPVLHWHILAEKFSEAGYAIKIPWGNDVEYQRAEWIAKDIENAVVLPKLNLHEIANVIANAKAVVAVDTGLGHLAAALCVPTVSLYGPTDPVLTGTVGENQFHLQAKFPPCVPCLRKTCNYPGEHVYEPPCLGSLTPEEISVIFMDMARHPRESGDLLKKTPLHSSGDSRFRGNDAL